MTFSRRVQVKLAELRAELEQRTETSGLSDFERDQIRRRLRAKYPIAERVAPRKWVAHPWLCECGCVENEHEESRGVCQHCTRCEQYRPKMLEPLEWEELEAEIAASMALTEAGPEE